MKRKINAIPAKNEEEKMLDVFSKLTEQDKVKTVVDKQPQTLDQITENRLRINNKIIDLFSNKVKKEIELKDTYAVYLIWILIGQLILLNLWFVLKGRGIIMFADSTFNIFITAGIAEVFVLVRVIVKYLFSDNIADLLKLIIRTTGNSGYQRNGYTKNKDNQNRNQ